MDIYEEIVKLRREGRRGAVATIVNVRGSIPSFKTAKMLVREDGSMCGTIGGGCVEADVWRAAREVMDQEKPRTLSFDLNQDPKYDTGLVCGGTLEIFIEPILPPAVLYIFGAGHVAQSLYKTARDVGFDVTVIDDRETFANRERFPHASEVIAQDFDQATSALPVSEANYIVIVTRGHRDDMRILRWAVQTKARYVGMIGSKRKTIAIFRELQKEGLPAELFERVHAPIGLDIGAITPEEIAVSITAELIAVRRRVVPAADPRRTVDVHARGLELSSSRHESGAPRRAGASTVARDQSNARARSPRLARAMRLQSARVSSLTGFDRGKPRHGLLVS